MQIKNTRAISTLSLLALGTVAMNCGEVPTDGSETVVSGLQNQLQTAFQRGSDNKLTVSTGPNFGSPSAYTLWGGTRPTQVPSGASGLKIAIQKSTNNLFSVIDYTVINGQGSFGEPFPAPTNRIWGGTSPQIAQCGSCSIYAYAFLGANGHMWAGTGPSPLNAFDVTGATMWGGTNPSIAMKSNGTVVFAYLHSNGQLYTGDGISSGNPGGSTGVPVWGGTSPSIAWGGSPTAKIAVAVLGTNGRLWANGDPGSIRDTGATMWGGTSPSIIATPNGAVFVAFRSQGGYLEIGKNVGDGFFFWFPKIAGANVAVNGSPNIYPSSPTGNGYQVVFKGSNGHLWISLNAGGDMNFDQVEDQGWAMN